MSTTDRSEGQVQDERSAAHRDPNLPRTLAILAVLAVVAVAQRLPFISIPPGQDEAGFFIIGQQWAPGSSLYGDFWVDRPPLLLTIFWLIDSIEWLRVVGCIAVVATLLLTAAAAYAWHGHRAAVTTAAVVTVFATAPMLGAVRVNGEMLAAPFVAAAMVLTVRMLRPAAQRPALLAAGAGAASALAFGVKQSTVDGFVFGGLALLTLALVERSWGRAVTLLGWAAAGALGTVLLLVGWAATRGTDPVELFHAVVTFRAEAGEVIRESASRATDARLQILVLSWFASGLALLSAAALAYALRERRDPIAVATAGAVLAASGVALLGGSYWPHYLIQLVPATALAAGPIVARLGGSWRTRGGRLVLVGSTWLVVVAAVAWLDEVRDPLGDGPAEATGALLAESAEPGDTVFVAYGQPNVVLNSGLGAPYEHLWSLPIRTADPDLADLTEVLESPDRPTWIVQWGQSFQTWGIDADEVEEIVRRDYTEVAEVCDRTIWLSNDVARDITTPEEC